MRYSVILLVLCGCVEPEIVGWVGDQNNQPVSAEVTGSGHAPTIPQFERTTETDDDGRYAMKVPFMATVIISTSLGAQVEPASVTFEDVTENKSGVDFVATRAPRTISGNVRDSRGLGINGVHMVCEITIDGIVYEEIVDTDMDGAWSVEVPYGCSLKITPVLEGWRFEVVMKT